MTSYVIIYLKSGDSLPLNVNKISGDSLPLNVNKISGDSLPLNVNKKEDESPLFFVGGQMKLYYVNDRYISYLRTFDSKVYFNKNNSRPYVGVVVSVNGINFFAPLTSPKPKHSKMKNSLDFRKINGGKLGAINLNYMIPVPNEMLELVDIVSIQDQNYKNLLNNQIRFLKSDSKEIENSATRLFNIVTKEDSILTPYQIQIKRRCCNFELLALKMKGFSLS